VNTQYFSHFYHCSKLDYAWRYHSIPKKKARQSMTGLVEPLPLVVFSLLELSRYPAFRFSEISRVIPRLGIARYVY
jgi:hypothetical protein